MGLLIHEQYLTHISFRLAATKTKIQYSNGINGLELVIPTLAFSRLVLNREGRIKNASVNKIFLFYIL